MATPRRGNGTGIPPKSRPGRRLRRQDDSLSPLSIEPTEDQEDLEYRSDESSDEDEVEEFTVRPGNRYEGLFISTPEHSPERNDSRSQHLGEESKKPSSELVVYRNRISVPSNERERSRQLRTTETPGQAIAIRNAIDEGHHQTTVGEPQAASKDTSSERRPLPSSGSRQALTPQRRSPRASHGSPQSPAAHVLTGPVARLSTPDETTAKEAAGDSPRIHDEITIKEKTEPDIRRGTRKQAPAPVQLSNRRTPRHHNSSNSESDIESDNADAVLKPMNKTTPPQLRRGYPSRHRTSAILESDSGSDNSEIETRTAPRAQIKGGSAEPPRGYHRHQSSEDFESDSGSSSNDLETAEFESNNERAPTKPARRNRPSQISIMSGADDSSNNSRQRKAALQAKNEDKDRATSTQTSRRHPRHQIIETIEPGGNSKSRGQVKAVAAPTSETVSEASNSISPEMRNTSSRKSRGKDLSSSSNRSGDATTSDQSPPLEEITPGEHKSSATGKFSGRSYGNNKLRPDVSDQETPGKDTARSTQENGKEDDNDDDRSIILVESVSSEVEEEPSEAGGEASEIEKESSRPLEALLGNGTRETQKSHANSTTKGEPRADVRESKRPLFEDVLSSSKRRNDGVTQKNSSQAADITSGKDRTEIREPRRYTSRPGYGLSNRRDEVNELHEKYRHDDPAHIPSTRVQDTSSSLQSSSHINDTNNTEEATDSMASKARLQEVTQTLCSELLAKELLTELGRLDERLLLKYSRLSTERKEKACSRVVNQASMELTEFVEMVAKSQGGNDPS